MACHLLLSICLLCASWSSASAKRHTIPQDIGTQTKIPRILHQIFLKGLQEYEKLAADGVMHAAYRASCARNHPTWEHMLWSQEQADLLVRQDFLWFNETWSNYTHWVRTVNAGAACSGKADLHGCGRFCKQMPCDTCCCTSTAACI